MTKEFQLIKDFVEGKLTDIEFESHLESLQSALEDNSLSWADTYVKTNPFDYINSLKINSIVGRLNTQGVLKLFLERKGIPTKEYKKYSEDFGLTLDTQPKYINADTDFIERIIIPANGKSKSEIKKLMKERFKTLFQYHKRPPKWIQSPIWPIRNDRPLYFLGQLEIKDCELFHDNGCIYIFIDTDSGAIETVRQFY